jgi:trans-aconitate methyltransferase
MTSRWQESGAPRGDAYDAQFTALAASGRNPHGEVDFVERLAPRTVLDAGCGTGRVAIELAARHVDAIGVDLDSAMLATARAKAPHLEWYEADLAELDLRDRDGKRRRFDVVVAAGNVMIFLAPGSEPTVLARLAEHLEPGGALVAGFQLGRQLSLTDYDRAADAAGLRLDARVATWDGAPFVDGGDYAVSVHRKVR